MRCSEKPAAANRLLALVQDPDTESDQIERALDRLLAIDGFIDRDCLTQYLRRLRVVTITLLLLLRRNARAQAQQLAEQALLRLQTLLFRTDDSGGRLLRTMRRLAQLHAATLNGQPRQSDHLLALLLADRWRLWLGLLDQLPWMHDPKLLSAARQAQLKHDGAKAQALSELIAALGGISDQRERGLEQDATVTLPAWRRRQQLLSQRDNEQSDATLHCLWQRFEQNPVVDNYARLLQTADHTVEGRGPWRERAIEQLRSYLIARRDWQSGYLGRPDRSLLVESLLWEGELEAAWREAKQGGCRASLWLKLAEERAAHHPEQALEVFNRFVESAIRRRNDSGYEEAQQLLIRIRELLIQLGRDQEWEMLLARLRQQYRRKQELMVRLEIVERVDIAL